MYEIEVFTSENYTLIFQLPYMFFEAIAPRDSPIYQVTVVPMLPIFCWEVGAMLNNHGFKDPVPCCFAKVYTLSNEIPFSKQKIIIIEAPTCPNFP